MARFKVWNGTEWCDACQKEVYVRDSSGVWRRVVQGSEVYTGGMWVEVDCFNYYEGIFKAVEFGCAGGDIPGYIRTLSTLQIGKWYKTLEEGAFYVSAESVPQPSYYETFSPLFEGNNCSEVLP